MSRTKRLCALCLCALCLCASPARAEDLIAPDAIVPETANYNTVEIVRGDYIQTAMAGATEVYPLTYRAKYKGVTARFVRLAVKKGDYVEEGDLIAEVEISVSRATLDSKELSLQRSRESYAAGVESRQEALSGAQRALSTAEGAFAREEARLRLERLRLEMEKYCYEQERAIRQMEEELAELREDYERTCMYAPASGYISDVVYLKEGEPVYSGTTLASLYSTDRLLLRVKNENGQFRYNMPVTVETGVAKSRVTVSGRVVATDLLLSSADRTENVAYIQLDDTGEEVALKNSQASCETVRILNVLTAPRATLTLEAGNYYVNKLVDGRVEKRFVNVRLANTQQLWVLQGLDEGDLVIRD